MKYFGLLSLLLVVGLGVYMVYQSGAQVATAPTADDTATTGITAIEEAKEAVAALEQRNGTGVTVYDGITVPQATEVLDLSGRALTGSLKAEIRHLEQLRSLDISDNEFTGLPAEIGQLANLESLDLSNNPLTGLPRELGNLQQLRTLDVRGTNYSEVDMEIIKASLPATTEILVD